MNSDKHVSIGMNVWVRNVLAAAYAHKTQLIIHHAIENVFAIDMIVCCLSSRWMFVCLNCWSVFALFQLTCSVHSSFHIGLLDCCVVFYLYLLLLCMDSAHISMLLLNHCEHTFESFSKQFMIYKIAVKIRVRNPLQFISIMIRILLAASRVFSAFFLRV